MRKIFATVAVAATAVAALSACTADTTDTGGKADNYAATTDHATSSATGDDAGTSDDSTGADAQAQAEPKYTVGQQEAIDSAQSYLSMGTGFSRAGLINQLSSKAGESFKRADAVFAVNHLKVDWNQQAVQSAKTYLQMGGFSRAGLIQQLTSKAGEQYTRAQARYAVNHVGLGSSSGAGTKDKPADSKSSEAAASITVAQENAIKSAQSYLSMGTGFSRAGLIDQLSSKAGEGFKKADAVFAVDHIKVDWNQQALQSAKTYMQMGGFSRASLIEQLTSKAGEQYTLAQATYAVNHLGL